jgi:hypothetical protein
MERLHPTVEDLGEIGYLLDAMRGHARILKGLFGAPGAEYLDSQLIQAASEIDKTCFVPDA